MTTADHRGRAEGVGIAYHPFLHDTLLECGALFDFVELPLDLYIDPARSGLLDPGQRRLQQVIAAKPCAWRGTALSLGTVGPDDAAGFAPHTVRSIRALLAMAGAEHYTDTIGFRTAGFGPMQPMPHTPEAAGWIATRQAAASDALGVPVRLCLPNPGIAAPAPALDRAAFLAGIAACGGTGVVVDAAGFAGTSPRELAGCLPGAHVAALSISSAGAPGWEMLAALAETIRPRSIVLRRDRQLFALDTIAPEIERAARLVASAAPPPAPACDAHASAPDLSALRAYQAAVASEAAVPDGKAQSWQNWRSQVDDRYKAQQIMALMAKGANPRAPWST